MHHSSNRSPQQMNSLSILSNNILSTGNDDDGTNDDMGDDADDSSSQHSANDSSEQHQYHAPSHTLHLPPQWS